MSFLARLIRRIRSPTGFVGKDLQGNSFYEYPSTSDDPRRTKRVVKYAQGTDMLDYVSGHRRLAVQWTSWMTHTRSDPPTIEELYADLERRRRILHSAALIEEQERQRAAQLAAAEQTYLQASPPPARLSQGATTNTPHDSEKTLSAEHSQLHTRRSDIQAQDAENTAPPSPWKPPPRDEPHSWTPRANVRRGG